MALIRGQGLSSSSMSPGILAGSVQLPPGWHGSACPWMAAHLPYLAAPWPLWARGCCYVRRSPLPPSEPSDPRKQ